MVTKMKHANTSRRRFDPALLQAAIEAAPDVAVFDGDCPPSRPGDWDNAIVSHSLDGLREQLAVRRRRGPGRKEAKESTTVRFDRDVLAAFKSGGPGWQTRMNDALRDWLKTHSPA